MNRRSDSALPYQNQNDALRDDAFAHDSKVIFTNHADLSILE